MKSNIKKYWINGIVFILSIFVIYSATFAKVDSTAKSRIESSFNQALGVFATAKALNGVISLVQGTEIGPPGVTISIGEILDPINDLVERFSWIMLASLSSLGIQKIFMNIVGYDSFTLVLVFSILVSNILYLIRLKKYKKSRNLFLKFTILLVFLRFSIPLMALSSEFVYVNFVQQDYSIEKSQKVIKEAQHDISKFDDKNASYFSTKYYKNKMIEFEKIATDAGNHIVDLIIVFIFQTMLFPLIFLFILYRLLISISHSFNFTV